MGADVSGATAVLTGNAAGDYFGWELWHEGSAIMTTAPNASGWRRHNGAAYLFNLLVPGEQSLQLLMSFLSVSSLVSRQAGVCLVQTLMPMVFWMWLWATLSFHYFL